MHGSVPIARLEGGDMHDDYAEGCFLTPCCFNFFGKPPGLFLSVGIEGNQPLVHLMVVLLVFAGIQHDEMYGALSEREIIPVTRVLEIKSVLTGENTPGFMVSPGEQERGGSAKEFAERI